MRVKVTVRIEAAMRVSRFWMSLRDRQERPIPVLQNPRDWEHSKNLEGPRELNVAKILFLTWHEPNPYLRHRTELVSRPTSGTAP